MYKKIIRPLLFLFDPEAVHHFTFAALKFFLNIPGICSLVKYFYSVNDKRLEKNLFGLHFPNPVGLAAGLDKDAKLFDELGYLGFGFIEIGTVTPLAQPGNIKPRLFRLKKDEALINRMGFNNEGAAAAAKRLRRRKSNIIIGVNIGKNKTTPIEDAVKDYLFCFKELFDVADYFVVNVSSPNTPNLRQLQEKDSLKNILQQLRQLNFQLSKTPNPKLQTPNRKPILLKIAPDLTNQQLDDIIEIIIETKTDGVIATNTTVSRENLKSEKALTDAIGAGGLSGRPLAERSTEVIRYLSEKSKGQFIIIGVGGIHSADGAMEKIKAGASLVQLYTGFIYEGPMLIREINKKILAESSN